MPAGLAEQAVVTALTRDPARAPLLVGGRGARDPYPARRAALAAARDSRSRWPSAWLLLLALAVGTRSGTTGPRRGALVTTLVLPGEMALEQYRLPVGGGGIFIVDILLFLARRQLDPAGSLSGHDASLVRSPVTLPLILFLVWTASPQR